MSGFEMLQEKNGSFRLSMRGAIVVVRHKEGTENAQRGTEKGQKYCLYAWPRPSTPRRNLYISY